MAIIQDVFKKEYLEKVEIKKDLDGKIAMLNKKILSIEDSFADGQLETSDYHSMKKRFVEDRNNLIQKHSEIMVNKSTFVKYFENSLLFLEHLTAHYRESTIELKQKIVSSIFPEKLVYSENKYRTPKINEGVALIINNIKDLQSTEIKKVSISADSSTVVHRRRIELLLPG